MITAEPNAESCKQLLDVFEQDFKDYGESVCITKLSIEDKQALRILGRSAKKVGDHYSVGLLLKDNEVSLKDNRSLAEKRLASLRKRFIQNPELFKKYNAIMAEYLERYAEPAGGESLLPSRINCIPHHCTAANTKFRVVFDCSARFNDKLLHSPDLTNRVMGVLLRFRQFLIGMAGNIESIFSQLLVDEEDRDALRFLWFKEGDLNSSGELPNEDARVWSEIATLLCCLRPQTNGE